jgi:hypothetical protein
VWLETLLRHCVLIRTNYCRPQADADGTWKLQSKSKGLGSVMVHITDPEFLIQPVPIFRSLPSQERSTWIAELDRRHDQRIDEAPVSNGAV